MGHGGCAGLTLAGNSDDEAISGALGKPRQQAEGVINFLETQLKEIALLQNRGKQSNL
jgi:hypothetical protein